MNEDSDMIGEVVDGDGLFDDLLGDSLGGRSDRILTEFRQGDRAIAQESLLAWRGFTRFNRVGFIVGTTRVNVWKLLVGSKEQI